MSCGKAKNLVNIVVRGWTLSIRGNVLMNHMKMHYGSLSGVSVLVLVSAGSVWADPIPSNSALANPFELSRLHANWPSDDFEKEPVPAKGDIPEAGDGHLLSDFVYYNSLEIQGGVSLFGGGGNGFPGGGFVGGGGGTGGSTQTEPSGGDEGYDEDSIPQNPAPGAVLLGMVGLSMTGWVRRRWA